MASPEFYAAAANLGLSAFLVALGAIIGRRSPDRAARGSLAVYLGLVGAGYLLQAVAELAFAANDPVHPTLARLALGINLLHIPALLWFAMVVTRHSMTPLRAVLVAGPTALLLALLLARGVAPVYIWDWEHRWANGLLLASFNALAWALLVQRYLAERSPLQRDRFGILVIAFGVTILPRLLLVAQDTLSPAAFATNLLQPALALIALAALLGLPRLAAPDQRAHATQTARSLAVLLGLVVSTWLLVLVPALRPAGEQLVYSVRWYIFVGVLVAGMRRFELLGVPPATERRLRVALAIALAALGFAGAASALAAIPGTDDATALGGAALLVLAAAAFLAAGRFGLPSAPGDLQWRRHALYRAHIELGSPPEELAQMRHALGLTVREAREVEALVTAEREAPPPQVPEPLAEGAVVLGRYHLERLLGTGAFGRVFAAFDRVAGERVVVKELHGEWRGDAEALEAFRREARVALRMRHANLVGFRGLERHGGADLLVLEHVEGPTLRQRFAQGPLGQAMAERLARDLLDGLAALHGVGIVHCDVKPENIVLRPDGRAVLLDFGAAHVQRERTGRARTRRGGAVGTPAYMSPEQSRGQRPDARADLYAVGVVLWEALTGAAPPNGKVPTAWAAWLQRALAREPRARWPDAAAMRRALPV